MKLLPLKIQYKIQRVCSHLISTSHS